MTISRIVIDQEFANLGIKVTPAQMSITTNVRRMVNSSTDYSKPEISGSGDVPAFQLNFSKLMTDIGVKDPATIAND
ncbi:MAG: hypothetical protein LBN43_10105, partial [Oscillospiraceae bacterium]|nr:hypothetical protein [Oscillospiraceae bacterium]